jgi:hypothetical protein
MPARHRLKLTPHGRKGLKMMGKTGGSNEQARKRHSFHKLTRLMLSVHDFEQAMSSAMFLLETVDEEKSYPLSELRRFRCYETAMVVAYARPFSMAKGEVRPLSWKDTGLPQTTERRALHQKLLKHRNTIYGHSDAEFVNVRVYLTRTYMKNQNKNFDWIQPRFDEGMRFTLDEIAKVEETARRLVGSLARQIQNVGSEFSDRFKLMSLDVDGP